ncbi:glycosyltransferase family 4 protein [Streptomyces sp. LaPpAH-108]|uniref:glycosyltransferase family 4 protein n=1 Tax=Streptomyces sp. LaPpAH-108 TaxID=1155714 RepID=UPI000684C715|nr:glycosyltransferase family 4 protein [Streptomyces sp. LaPpAH-108]
MKITFLIHNIYGVGGTIRTTLNLATALADRHDVEIVSMLRHRTNPRFAVDPRITLTPLVDLRPDSDDTRDPLMNQPAVVFPKEEKRHQQYSRLTDLRAERFLRTCDADVIIGTRPGINVYLREFGSPKALRIAQEHLTHDAHSRRLRAVLGRHYRALDAVVTTTKADARVYEQRMRLPGVRVTSVPNGVPRSAVEPANGQAKVIATAGRLVKAKRFDLLIEAFTVVAAKHPDWSLRIYGHGREETHLQQLIEQHGLGGRARLMGFHAPIEKEFAAASVVAVASEAESFGMTIVEAMRCGVPVVSTDCPLGPGEIITDGVDGRLVPVGDRDALAAALLELVENPDLRRRMGAAALRSAEQYEPAVVAGAYEALFDELNVTRRPRARERRRALWRGRAARVLRRMGVRPRAAKAEPADDGSGARNGPGRRS